METLNISTGEKRLAINGDESKVISFNPMDVGFADRFYALISEFEKRQNEFQDQYKVLESDNTPGDGGIPANMGERLALVNATCNWIRERIDYVFGKGTSQTVFGHVNSLELFVQFFQGITPHIQATRTKRIEKYVQPKQQPRKRTRSKTTKK